MFVAMALNSKGGLDARRCGMATFVVLLTLDAAGIGALVVGEPAVSILESVHVG